MEFFTIVMIATMTFVLCGLVSVAIEISDIRDRVRNIRQTLENIKQDTA